MDSVDAVRAEATFLMGIVEELKGGMGVDEKVTVGIIIVCPSSGEVTWDEFEGNVFIHCFSDATEVDNAQMVICVLSSK